MDNIGHLLFFIYYDDFLQFSLFCGLTKKKLKDEDNFFCVKCIYTTEYYYNNELNIEFIDTYAHNTAAVCLASNNKNDMCLEWKC